mgnify:CR=1 FL=1|tara:strand:+ start:483 stop:1070 length:588 start_codon:yes stop_codon:yes gene_type:complete
MPNKVPRDDWQYFAPFLVCIICFIASDFLGIIEKTSVAYWSGRLLAEPYRVITSHFFHGNINHLLANISGIIVARYFLKTLKLRSDYFLFLIISLLIPLQVFICWCVDLFVYGNPNSLAIGFSGILFGIDSFILMTTIYGKKRFIFIKCEMKKNISLVKSISILTGIGFLWSFLPGISFLGHLSGFVAGILLFWL